jgi:phage terminase large subunit-like protein
MIESVLRGVGAGLPIRLVHAAKEKAARAEPVALRFETGRARLAGRFPELEDQLAQFTYAGYQGQPGPGGRDGLGDERAVRDAPAGPADHAALKKGTVT